MNLPSERKLVLLQSRLASRGIDLVFGVERTDDLFVEMVDRSPVVPVADEVRREAMGSLAQGGGG